MVEKPSRSNVRPKDLEWLAGALKLNETLADAPALESLLDSLPAISLETWPAYQDILREGEDGADFFVIYSGELSVWRRGRRKESREVGRLVAGDFFGEISGLMESPRSATVRSESACRVFRFPAAEFYAVLERHHLLTRWVRQVACRRLERLFRFADR